MSTSSSVCVFCSSGTTIHERYLELAGEVGAEIGRRGLTLVSGAGSISSMGALARSARSAGARTVGVIPQALMAYEVVDTDADELIVTADMRERKSVMDARADAFLVLPGGIGTMEEFFEAWVGRALGMHRKPLVVLDPWYDYRALHDLVRSMVAGGFVSEQVAAEVAWTTSVAEAFTRLDELWSAPPTESAPGLAEAVLQLEAD